MVTGYSRQPGSGQRSQQHFCVSYANVEFVRRYIVFNIAIIFISLPHRLIISINAPVPSLSCAQLSTVLLHISRRPCTRFRYERSCGHLGFVQYLQILSDIAECIYFLSVVVGARRSIGKPSSEQGTKRWASDDHAFKIRQVKLVVCPIDTFHASCEAWGGPINQFGPVTQSISVMAWDATKLSRILYLKFG